MRSSVVVMVTVALYLLFATIKHALHLFGNLQTEKTIEITRIMTFIKALLSVKVKLVCKQWFSEEMDCSGLEKITNSKFLNTITEIYEDIREELTQSGDANTWPCALQLLALYLTETSLYISIVFHLSREQCWISGEDSDSA